ncbi:hypothetical protein TIFTF001_042614, partial [Ficus carica]
MAKTLEVTHVASFTDSPDSLSDFSLPLTYWETTYLNQ